MKKSIFLLLFLLPILALAQEIPKLSSPVTDAGEMLSPEAEKQITALIISIEQATTAEIVVLTVPSLEGMSKEEFSAAVFEKNKFGKKDKDNGLLLLISRDDRVYRAEVGYGLEPYITDAQKVGIGTRIIETHFKQGNFDQGVFDAVAAMGGLINGEEDVISKYGSSAGVASRSTFSLIMNIIFIILFVSIILGRSGFWFFPIFIGGNSRGGMSSGGFGSSGFGGGFGGGSFSGGGFGGSF
tara:strand:- start:572 stop:1294 length:723 start_codon:yes stop_codon:yes gene_type:complete